MGREAARKAAKEFAKDTETIQKETGRRVAAAEVAATEARKK